MKLRFWGVRGSIPAPGPETNRYGGNTPCVSIVDDKGHLCVIDMGTGIVPLGMALLGKKLEVDGDFGKGQATATVLLSHAHWDHIQGFPFFAPVFISGNRFVVYGHAKTSERVESILEGQMNPQFSPIYTLKNMGASIEFEAIADEQCFQVSNLEICGRPNPHGETTALAFRLVENGRSVVYASDVGYEQPGPDEGALGFYRDADVLIHDSTYTPAEQENRRSRGLSTYLDAARMAHLAGVGKVILFHYDQDHADDLVDECVRACGKELERLGSAGIEVLGASEGLELTI
jgi:phosphoribosyl 1,2-cyclic phosphodiesterase